MSDILPIVLGVVQGLASSTVFVLVLFIGFCVVVGFTKTKRTAGDAPVVKSLDEAVTRQAMQYMPSNTPHGPIDQLKGAVLKSEV
jgi:hypothetical protein